MKQKKKLPIKSLVTNYFVMTLTIFAIITIIFASISEYIYQDISFGKNLIIFAIISSVASLFLLGFLQINKISIVVQVIVIYLFLSAIILITGYLLYFYDLIYNVKLFIATIMFLVIGLVIIVLISVLRVKISNASLNKYLKNFKERDR